MQNYLNILDIMLPPSRWGRKLGMAGINEESGAKRVKGIHHGIDFNYHAATGEKFGQSRINIRHPILYSPVTGVVTDIRIKWGWVEITDRMGYKHQVLHMVKKSWGEFIAKGQEIEIGHAIGRMGRTSPTITNGDFHAHYQIEVPAKNIKKHEPGELMYRDRDRPGGKPKVYIHPRCFKYGEFTSRYRPGQFYTCYEWPKPLIAQLAQREDLYCDNPSYPKRQPEWDPRVPIILRASARRAKQYR